MLACFWGVLGGSSVAITSIDTSDASLGSSCSVLRPKIVSYRCIKLKKKINLTIYVVKTTIGLKNQLDRPVRLPRLSFNDFYTLALVVHMGASI